MSWKEELPAWFEEIRLTHIIQDKMKLTVTKESKVYREPLTDGV